MVLTATSGERPDESAHEDLAGGRCGLKARGLDDRRTVTVVGDELDVAHAQADAQHQLLELVGMPVV